MLFNSHLFLLLFLPLTLGLYALAGRLAGVRAALGVLVVASLVFYGWWVPQYLPLILLSIVGNYAVGRMQARSHAAYGHGSLALNLVAVAANLGLLGWYKYANFSADLINALAGTPFIELATIILPMGISFYTFQQLAYVIDSYHGLTKDQRFLDYTLFVTFFPQLIAGPIVHYREVMPQFARCKARIDAHDVRIGLTILAIGLFKKVMIADTLGNAARPVFSTAADGMTPGLFEAWGGLLAYTGQLYFDFSGYCDMAVGASRMFGITLPANFDAPLKARSIIEFWQRWHITLSRFLRDYVFLPLCGRRRPTRVRRLSALFLTMVLGGIWHGAGFTFIIWGALHGTYLVINHLWRELAQARNWPASGRWLSLGYGALTFLAFIFSLVFFRAADVSAAGHMLTGLLAGEPSLPKGWGAPFGLDDEALVGAIGFWGTGGFPASAVPKLLAAFVLIWFFPTTQQLLYSEKPVLGRIEAHRWGWLAWRPKLPWALATTVLLGICLLYLARVSEFLYWTF